MSKLVKIEHNIEKKRLYEKIFKSYRLQQKWYHKINHDSEKSLLYDRWSKNRKTILAPLVVIVEL